MAEKILGTDLIAFENAGQWTSPWEMQQVAETRATDIHLLHDESDGIPNSGVVYDEVQEDVA